MVMRILEKSRMMSKMSNRSVFCREVAVFQIVSYGAVKMEGIMRRRG